MTNTWDGYVVRANLADQFNDLCLETVDLFRNALLKRQKAGQFRFEDLIGHTDGISSHFL